jgi:DegV family protein with EDD domain
VAVQVITDSTADIPPELVKKYNIRTVPIYIRFGEKTYRDGIDLQSNEFYSMLKSSSIHPATSQPNPEDFTGVYKEYCETSSGIVSIHVSSKISGTCNSARMAQKALAGRCPIEVVDSTFNSGGLGLVVLASARLAKSGVGFKEVLQEARRTIGQVRMFGMFQTMKYLARSGRVNKTIAAASRVLNVMPLLTFHDGEIIRAGLVRTAGKGIDRIYSFVKNNFPVTEVNLVHSDALDQVYHLKKRLSEFIPDNIITISQLGAALGVHGGPGVLVAAVRRAG